MADLYDHLDEKSKSEKKDLCADSTFFYARRSKFRLWGQSTLKKRFVEKFLRFEVSVDR